jgi:RNA polymerase sigma-70 factor, ECF subfamily
VGSDFDELRARYRPSLLAFARKLCQGAPSADPEDLVQDTFMRFMEEGLYDQGGDAMGWLIKVLHRRFIDLVRSHDSHQKAETDPTITRWTLTNDDVPATYERITQERFDWAVNKLPENQRITILLKLEGHDHKEIARQLGISVPAVTQRLFNARQNLHQLLQPYVEEGIH